MRKTPVDLVPSVIGNLLRGSVCVRTDTTTSERKSRPSVTGGGGGLVRTLRTASPWEWPCEHMIMSGRECYSN